MVSAEYCNSMRLQYSIRHYQKQVKGFSQIHDSDVSKYWIYIHKLLSQNKNQIVILAERGVQCVGISQTYFFQ